MNEAQNNMGQGSVEKTTKKDSENLKIKKITTWLEDSYGISREQIEMLLKAFRKTTVDTIGRLKENLASNDLDAISKSAHKIKGSLIQVGLYEESEIALSIEEAANAGKDMDYATAVYRLEEMLMPIIETD